MRKSIILLSLCCFAFVAFSTTCDEAGGWQCQTYDITIPAENLQQQVPLQQIPLQQIPVQQVPLQQEPVYTQTFNPPMNLIKKLTSNKIVAPKQNMKQTVMKNNNVGKFTKINAPKKHNAPVAYYIDARHNNYIDARRNDLISNRDGDDYNYNYEPSDDSHHRFDDSDDERTHSRDNSVDGSRGDGGNRIGANGNGGTRNEGVRNVGGRIEGTRNEGNRNEGNRNEGNRNEGNRNEGNRNEGNRNDGNRNGGFRFANSDGPASTLARVSGVNDFPEDRFASGNGGDSIRKIAISSP